MSGAKLPRLLDAGMNERARLHPIRQTVSLALVPLSTASLTLPPDEHVAVHDWVELYTATGSAGIFRVASVRRTYTGTTTVELEHGLCALGDGILMGEGQYSGTAQEVLAQMLAHQVTQIGGAALFVVGTVADVSTLYDYSYNNILTAVKELAESMGDYAITCDQSTLPWRVGLSPLETVPGCEGRLARNIEGIQVVRDDADLCTRVFCAQLDGAQSVDGPTIGTYGTIIKTVTTAQNAVQADLRAYINRYLDDHKHPSVSIEMSAQDLSAITGEPLDHFAPGALCRIALPDYAQAMNERVIEVDYQNVLEEPWKITVKLSNRLRDTAKNIATIEAQTMGSTSSNKARGSGGGRGTGITPAKLIDMLMAEETVIDETGGTYFKTRIDLTAQGAAITAQQTHLDSALGRISEAEASISVNADNISLKVSKDGVISSINQTAEAVKIQASRIDLDGYVTASNLSSQLATMRQAMANEMYIGRFSCGSSFGMGSATVTLGSKTVMTNATLSVNSTGGTVTGVSINKWTSKIYYLDWE